MIEYAIFFFWNTPLFLHTHLILNTTIQSGMDYKILITLWL